MYSSLEEFAGSAVCAQCHKEISTSQRMTPMARTLARADGSAVPREHPDLGFDHREYKFRISTANGKSIYSVSNGKEKISALLAWAFRLGHVGQSYLYERDGAWHEARSTYFPTPDVRCKVPGVPCEWKERSGDGKASWESVSGGDLEMFFMPHAEDRNSGNALCVYRSRYSRSPGRKAVAGLR
jgi:hypothetical protein